MYKVTIKGKTILSILRLDFKKAVNLIQKSAPADFEKLFPLFLFGGVSFIFYDSTDNQEKHVFIAREK